MRADYRGLSPNSSSGRDQTSGLLSARLRSRGQHRIAGSEGQFDTSNGQRDFVLLTTGRLSMISANFSHFIRRI